MLQTPQNEGYKKFFTNKKMHGLLSLWSLLNKQQS